MAEAITNLSDAKAKLQRFKSQLLNYKENAKHAARVSRDSMIVVAGGAAAGAIQNKLPYLPGTTIPTAAAVGVGLIALGASGMLDEQSDSAAFLGAGMLAALAAKETDKLLSAAA